MGKTLYSHEHDILLELLRETRIEVKLRQEDAAEQLGKP